MMRCGAILLFCIFFNIQGDNEKKGWFYMGTKVVSINPNWRCNAVPPSMRETTTQRISKNLTNIFNTYAHGMEINKADSAVTKAVKNGFNAFTLYPVDGLKGLPLFSAKLHNLLLAGSGLNPFATVSYWRNMLA